MNRYIVILLLAGALTSGFLGCGADTGDAGPPPATGTVFARLPEHPEPAAHWLIFLHGAIAEGDDRQPVHPRFGTYQLDAILEAFAARGFTVVGEQRPAGAEPKAWAERVADNVRVLLAAGVAPADIAIVGFSKGGVIALLAADRLARDDLNVVAMAACGPWVGGLPELVPAGRLLSLRDRSDDLVGSCAPLFARMGPDAQTREIVLDIGGGHGAFFAPHPEWLDPISDWLRPPPSATDPA